jgi:pentatricopeptide repeat protein
LDGGGVFGFGARFNRQEVGVSWRNLLLSREYLFHRENGERLLTSGCLGEARIELEKALERLKTIKSREEEELEEELQHISKELISQNLQKASYYRQEGELDIALDFLQNSLGLARDNHTKDEILLEMSALKMEMNPDASIKALGQKPDSGVREIDEIFELAMEYALSGFYERAIFELKKALTIEPENDEIYLRLGNACIDSGRYIEALDYYEKGLSLAAENKAQFYFRLGKLHALSAENKRAEEYLKKAVELEPESNEAFSALATLYSRQGRIDEAVDCYEKMIALDREDMDSMLKLAELFERGGYLKSAREIWREIVERSETALHSDIAKEKLSFYEQNA